MDKSVILSIVIPVYNVEKYLKECLDSIIEGIDKVIESEGIELIIVNDGSTDNSGSICMDYANNFDYVKYFYQDNKGLSGARNTGIRQAIGKYILFIDSDDIVNASIFGKMIESSSMGCDVFFLNAVKWYPNENKLMDFGEYYVKEDIIDKSSSDVLRNLTKFRKFPGSAWNKMIRRDFILEHQLFFEEGIYSEDLEWSIRLFKCAEKFGYLDGIFYYYRQGRIDSITGTLSDKNVNALIYLLEKYNSFEFRCDISSSQFSFLSYEYLVLLYLLGKLDRFDPITMGKVYSFRKVLYKSHKISYKILYFFISILGIRVTSKLLAKIKG